MFGLVEEKSCLNTFCLHYSKLSLGNDFLNPMKSKNLKYFPPSYQNLFTVFLDESALQLFALNSKIEMFSLAKSVFQIELVFYLKPELESLCLVRFDGFVHH